MALGSGDGTVRLWDSAIGAAHGSLEGHTSTVWRVTFSLDGKLMASGSGDGTIRLWDLAIGAVRGSLEGHTGSIYSIAFSLDGSLWPWALVMGLCGSRTQP